MHNTIYTDTTATADDASATPDVLRQDDEPPPVLSDIVTLDQWRHA